VKAKKSCFLVIVICMVCTIVGCSYHDEEFSATLNVLAAASLTDALEEIGVLFTQKTGTAITFNFDSSGTLKTQIENGAPADVFISAAMLQMDALVKENLIDTTSVISLLENEMVLIKPKDSTISISSFEEITCDQVKVIAIGNSNVPVGMYTEAIFTQMGIWHEVSKKATFGTNVRQVLDWVASNNVDCGIVYASDAAIEENVEVISAAPKGSYERVIYPAGIVNGTKQEHAAADFLNFLQTDVAVEIFEKYHFSMYKEG
jgi:molybdenum ABC transporter, periplasmic molybdate-binding protein